MFNFALSVKISAADIAEALIRFQNNSEKMSANPALPASQQGSLVKQPPPAISTPGTATVPPPVPKKAPPPGGQQAKAPGSEPQAARREAPAAPAEPEKPEKPLPKATWDSPPHCQQQGHRDYADKTKWKADESSWKLLDDCLLKLVPKPLEAPARRRRIPQDRPPIEERPPAAPVPGEELDSDLLGPGQPAAAAPSGTKHGPPPAGPPPQPPPGPPPPGPSGTGGAGGPDGDPGESGGQKECKQQ